MENEVKDRGELKPGVLVSLLREKGANPGFSGFIDVFGFKQRGQVWIRQGMPVAAQWQDEEGEEALQSMLHLARGRFEVDVSTAFPARNIHRGLDSILKDCIEVPEVVPMPPPRRRKGERVKRLAMAAGLMAVLGVGTLHAVEWWSARANLQETMAVPQESVVTVSVPVQPMKQVQDGWPCLSLSALVACGKARACAILNGQIIEAGGVVDGITVHSIRANGVLLEYQGKRRFVAMEKRVTM